MKARGVNWVGDDEWRYRRVCRWVGDFWFLAGWIFIFAWACAGPELAERDVQRSGDIALISFLLSSLSFALGDRSWYRSPEISWFTKLRGAVASAAVPFALAAFSIQWFGWFFIACGVALIEPIKTFRYIDEDGDAVVDDRLTNFEYLLLILAAGYVGVKAGEGLAKWSR